MQIEKDFRNYLQLTHQPRSINTYCSMLRKFWQQYPDPLTAKQAHIVEYMLSYKSYAARKQIRGAMLALFRMLGHPGRVQRIPYPRKRKTVKVALTKDQVRDMARALTNSKHRSLLCVAYIGGLRVSELCNLRWQDIHWQAGEMIITGKGAKQRMIPLSARMLEMLRQHQQSQRPGQAWVFPGQGGGPYSSRSAQKVIQKAAGRAGISLRISVHTLRHSRATHMLQAGVPLQYIQLFLGHARITTTQDYLHPDHQEMKQVIINAA